jgi:hypothetical protein
MLLTKPLCWYQVTAPTGNNIITFPDASGTIITTGNLPTSVTMPEEDYAIQSEAFVAAAARYFRTTNLRFSSTLVL